MAKKKANKKFVRLKVFTNKSNSQAAVFLPKKKFSTIPKFVKIRIRQRKKRGKK